MRSEKDGIGLLAKLEFVIFTKCPYVLLYLQIYPIYLFGYRKIPQRAYLTAVFFCVCRESKEGKCDNEDG